MDRSDDWTGLHEVLGIALLLFGCETTVELRGECQLETGPTVLGESLGAMPGLIPGEPYVFVATNHVERRGAMDYRVTWDAHFWSWDLREEVSAVQLGAGRRSVPPRWASIDGALHGLLPADPASPADPPPPEDSLHWWSIPAPGGGEATHESLTLPTVRTGCCGPFGPGDATLSFSGATIDTVVDARGEPTVLFPAVTVACGEAFTNFKRAHWARPSDSAARPLLWDEETCDPFDESTVAFVTPVASDGGLVTLLRSGAGKIRYLGLESTASGLVAPSSPRVVGGEEPRASVPFGGDHWQPQAAAAGGRILFTDRAGDSSCHYLRTMREDGTGARRTPWQLPCADGGWVTGNAELLAVGQDLVALVWNEAEVARESATSYRQRIRMALLTPEGRRASEIVEVASTERSAELPPSWEVRAASDGEGRIALTFSGSSAAGTGLHAATLSCSGI